jgi:tetratricopeptide (TPR) repeat protein
VTTDLCPGGVRRWLLVALALLGLASSPAARPADFSDARRQFLAGQYAAAIELAQAAVREQVDDEDWQLLLSQALLAVGRYAEARTVITNALEHEPRSLRLRWQARDVFLGNGQPEDARQSVKEIVQRVSYRPRGYQDPTELIAFGQAALLSGADPKRVLDQVFEPARKAQPKLRDVYLASGGLALDKHDFALAARKYEEGLKELPGDPDLEFGLAQAYAPSDAASMVASLEEALKRNSNHVGSLLLLADHSIDAEDYAQAEALLDRVQAVNPHQPQAWAYRAVVAHLQHQPEAERTARQTALNPWPANPQVDYLIGLKLSQNYRFTEGAAHQRLALEHDPDYLPAKAQLAQDLLRLGEETEGWKLAQEVQKQDGYDVEAYNLVTLHDTMGKFLTLTNGEFLVRMGAQEAAVYGPRVLDLLGQARSNLCAKYGLDVKRPTTVEIFPEQKDFAVRTFGMPGNPGYLGVCFGSVITANSPASHPERPINWEAVLWHEFCHVVTLQMTHNKMPRWLSEGISVYEELQANPAWGQHLSPRYREMILDDELTPVSQLSAAFLAPESDLYLQFAYFESALVVEFLVDRFGLDALKAILHDLGEGGEINATIAKHTVPMAKLETDFATFATERANQLGPGLDWERPDSEPPEPSAPREQASAVPPTRTGTTNAPAIRPHAPGPIEIDDVWQAWADDHPTNYWVMSRQARELIEAEQWTEAKPILERILALYPESIGADSAYRFLAQAHRALGETEAERQALASLAQRDDEAPDAYARLMELGAQSQDWPAVVANARRYLAVNPLVRPPYEYLLQASEELRDLPTAIGACRALLALEPTDRAEAHFHLAELLYSTGTGLPEARRHVLEALEEAPRYRAALRLLQELNALSNAIPADGVILPSSSSP